MTAFRKLCFVSTAATFLLVTIGGLVRATKSGLGCGTSWPDCSGDIIPVFGHSAVVIEYSHRIAAGVVVILLASLVVMAFRQHRQTPSILRTSLVAFGLVMFQAVLGAVVVKLELEAESVVMHLGTAMALLGVLIYLSIRSSALEGEAPVRTDGDASKSARFAARAVLLLLLLGSYISGQDAGYVFPDWPLMDGRVVPDLSSQPEALHFIHRLAAAVVGVIVVVVALRIMRRKGELPVAARFAHAAVGLFGIEVAIGAGNVWTGGNATFVTKHLAIGAAIWGSLVALASVTSPAVAETDDARVESRAVAQAGAR